MLGLMSFLGFSRAVDADGIALVGVTRFEEVGVGVDSVAGVSCPRFLFLGTS